MKATLILADSAQVAAGKLYLIGGGWSITEPKLPASAIAGKIEIPWSEADKEHSIKIELLDEAANPFLVQIVNEYKPLIIEAKFSVKKSPDLPEGTPSDVPFAFTIRPLSLEPGKRYLWKLSIDSTTKEDWQVGFFTKPSAKKPPFDLA